ncbi:MAG: tetratricopeptide repeat protein [Anaerolineales bacterium]|nr:tetratricopeptide repeat protein [Anaerolineales bacterium]
MTQSNDNFSRQNPLFVTISFLVVMAVLFIVVIGILPYRTSNATLSGTPTVTPDPYRQYQFGVTDYLTGNYPAALEDFTRSIDAQYSPMEEALYQRGLVYYTISVQNEDESAADNSIADLEAAIALAPNYFKVYPALGWSNFQKASFATGDEQTAYYQKALDIFQQGAALYKKNGKTDAQIFDGLGWTNYKLGNLEVAIEFFMQAINFNPGLEDAQIGLNAAKADLGK